jgi:hypothetical protein
MDLPDGGFRNPIAVLRQAGERRNLWMLEDARAAGNLRKVAAAAALG